jgi:hypothetical protein
MRSYQTAHRQMEEQIGELERENKQLKNDMLYMQEYRERF